MFLETERKFTFHLPDTDDIFTESDIESIEDPKLKEWAEAAYSRYLHQEKHYERNWRNYELTQSDWMLVSDATFEGENLAGSDRLEEIKEYRKKLREYDLTKPNRPIKPTWL